MIRYEYGININFQESESYVLYAWAAHLLLAGHPIFDNSLEHKAARHEASNVKFAVISCFITVNWKHVAGRLRCWWRSCTHPIGVKLSLGPRGTRLFLFIQIAGKHSVFSKRRQLLLHFCPLFLRRSIILHFPQLCQRVRFLLGHSGRQIFGIWHLLCYVFTYIQPCPKAILYTSLHF